MSLIKISGSLIQSNTISANNIASNVELGGPKIANVQIANSSWGVLDDTAVDVAGGYVIINGSGFQSGCQVIVGTTAAQAVTFVDTSTLRVQVAAQSAGTKFVYVVNPDGGTATSVNGLTYSASPTWVTGSTLSDAFVDIEYTYQLTATGATSYTLEAGSSLPANATLHSNGLLVGTTSGVSNTTYTFTVLATDAENQDSPRTFSLPILLAQTDEYYSNVSLLLLGNGADNGTTITDSGPLNSSLTLYGNVRTRTNIFKYGTASIYFDGADDYLTVPANSGFVFGTGDFTIEAWVYINTAPADYQAIINNWDSGWWFGHNGSKKLTLLKTGGGLVVETTANTPLQQWVHVAASRSGTTTRLFIDGTVVANTTSDTNNYSGSNVIFIGGTGTSGTHSYNGYMDDIRVTKGVARYTANFTPPAEEMPAM